MNKFKYLFKSVGQESLRDYCVYTFVSSPDFGVESVCARGHEFMNFDTDF